MQASGWRAILLTRGVRGFVDGLVSVLLAGYLSRLGFTPAAVGAIVTGTLVGSAALTIGVGLAGYRLDRRRVLLGASLLMLGTGLGFATFTAFWPLFIVAVVGTLNPSAGDVSVFLPVEQAVLAEMVRPAERTTAFAWYNVSGTLAGALGALVSGL
ncbi:MAG TPA: MFS transporter, partial [Candidatus Binatus sp.]|nr:MFS transporter [Candidatus Binatus sp.]